MLVAVLSLRITISVSASLSVKRQRRVELAQHTRTLHLVVMVQHQLFLKRCLPSPDLLRSVQQDAQLDGGSRLHRHVGLELSRLAGLQILREDGHAPVMRLGNGRDLAIQLRILVGRRLPPGKRRRRHGRDQAQDTEFHAHRVPCAAGAALSGSECGSFDEETRSHETVPRHRRRILDRRLAGGRLFLAPLDGAPSRGT